MVVAGTKEFCSLVSNEFAETFRNINEHPSVIYNGGVCGCDLTPFVGAFGKVLRVHNQTRQCVGLLGMHAASRWCIISVSNRVGKN